MATVHITDITELQAGDKVSLAPHGINLFQSEMSEVVEQDGKLGVEYFDGENTAFFPILTVERKPLGLGLWVLMEATREVVVREDEKHVGKVINIAADLPAEYGVSVILRHPKYGDFRGFASNDKFDGFEWIKLINGEGYGSFRFWQSDNYTIHLAEGIEFPYNL